MEFRMKAWDKSNREWLKNYHITPEGLVYQHQEYEGNLKLDNIVLVLYSTVADKNGKRIYEGDIVECTIEDDKKILGEVVFKDGMFLVWDHKEWYGVLYTLEVEVKGNMSEHSNLLEDGK